MSKNNTFDIEEKINQSEKNIDQIREILFGTQEKELNDRFEKFQKETNKFQKEILEKVEDNQGILNSKFNKKNKSIKKRLKKLKALQKEHLLETKRNQIKHKNSLKAEVESLKEELLDIINSKTKNLKNKKLSKNDLAKMMLDIAVNLKGSKKLQKKIKKLDKSKKKEK